MKRASLMVTATAAIAGGLLPQYLMSVRPTVMPMLPDGIKGLDEASGGDVEHKFIVLLQELAREVFCSRADPNLRRVTVDYEGPEHGDLVRVTRRAVDGE